jgi:hypothetical protein
LPLTRANRENDAIHPSIYAGATLPGDFNNDGPVDARDDVWRKGLGNPYAQTHYDIWRAHFGQLPGSAAQRFFRIQLFPKRQRWWC